MLPGLAAGAALALGLLLIGRGLMPSPPPLSAALTRLHRGDTPTGTGSGDALALRALRMLHPQGPSEALAADLRVSGRDVRAHAVAKLVGAWTGALLAAAAGTGAAMAGAGIPWTVVGIVTVVAAAVGFVVPDAMLRNEARARRREFTHALGSYVELVVVVLAGGGGPETALHDAAEAGEGWAFAEIRQALEAARLAGRSPWVALERLGADLGGAELVELAANVTLAGEHGARVRASLTAKASSMREHRLARIQAEAEAATEKMGIPTVLMLFGFIAFVLYPAMQFVLSGL